MAEREAAQQNAEPEKARKRKAIAKAAANKAKEVTAFLEYAEQLQAQQASERRQQIHNEQVDKQVEAQQAAERTEAAARKAAAKAKAKKDKSDSLQNRLFADTKHPRSLRRVPRPRRSCASSRACVILDIINKNNTINLNKIEPSKQATQQYQLQVLQIT